MGRPLRLGRVGGFAEGGIRAGGKQAERGISSPARTWLPRRKERGTGDCCKGAGFLQASPRALLTGCPPWSKEPAGPSDWAPSSRAGERQPDPSPHLGDLACAQVVIAQVSGTVGSVQLSQKDNFWQTFSNLIL